MGISAIGTPSHTTDPYSAALSSKKRFFYFYTIILHIIILDYIRTINDCINIPPVEHRQVGLNLHGLYGCSFPRDEDKEAILTARQPPI